ncbi:DMT family transporter [Pedobacter alpinus]|uniref:DMT family transporter n=1 Tax=Pedobacter alpinus TaxID=1590643 RepID=A0ABW5TU18_9SPHI
MKSLSSFKLPMALFGVSFFWGTTYLAIRIAVETIPAVYVVGFRHLMAGIILFTYLFISKKLVFPGWQRIFQNVVLAFLMLILANGLTTYGEKSIPSGLTALLTTLSPLLVLIINLASKKEKLSAKIAIGVLLGLAGMVVLFFNSLAQLTNPNYKIGIIAIICAIIAWSIGTVYSKSVKKDNHNILVDLCTQMLFAGISLLIAAFLLKIPLVIIEWKTSNILAVFYLTLFGSLAGFLSYLYALSKMASTSVSVFTYFNVVVALFLGWLILNEEITIRLIFATGLILLGVLIANYQRKNARSAVQGMLIEK